MSKHLIIIILMRRAFSSHVGKGSKLVSAGSQKWTNQFSSWFVHFYFTKDPWFLMYHVIMNSCYKEKFFNLQVVP